MLITCADEKCGREAVTPPAPDACSGCGGTLWISGRPPWAVKRYRCACGTSWIARVIGPLPNCPGCNGSYYLEVPLLPLAC